MDEINDNWRRPREIEAAMEAVGTTYFNEEAEYAKEVTEKTLGTFEASSRSHPKRPPRRASKQTTRRHPFD